MKKEFDLKIDGGTLESIKIDSSNSLIVATYKRDEEVEKLDISEIVVDLPTACEYLKESMPQNYAYDAETDFEHQINTQIKLQIIAEAWNKFDEFEADWESPDQCKYYPLFRIKDGNIKLSYTSFTLGFLDFHRSNFIFKTEERAKQFGEQFIDLFKVALGF